MAVGAGLAAGVAAAGVALLVSEPEELVDALVPLSAEAVEASLWAAVLLDLVRLSVA